MPVASFRKREMQKMKHTRKILIIFCFVILLYLGLLAGWDNKGILFDEKLLLWISENQSPGILSFMKVISFLGSELFLFPAVGLAIVYMLIKRYYYSACMLLSASLGSWIANHTLKQIFQRVRPEEFFKVQEGGLSYPSGHSMVSMSMFLTIAFLIARKQEGKTDPKTPYAAAILYIAIMGLSRLSLGVHWPTDILGGYAGGYLYYLASARLIDHQYNKKKSKALS